MSSKFDDIHQHAMNRYAFGGVQVRDYVKIKDTNIDGLSDEIKAELKKVQSDDLNIKVLEVVKSTPEDGKNTQDVFAAVIGQEIAGGLFPTKFTVPVNKLEVVGFNVPESIPDSWKAEMKVDFDGKPEKAPEVGGEQVVKGNEPTPEIKQL
jgi:hypothetical protein